MKNIILFFLTLSLHSCSTKLQNPPSPQAPSFSKEEMMKKIVEYATPGQKHQALEPLIGKWRIESKFWTDPKEEPVIDKGYANHYWILDGRYIKEDYEGSWNGQPFKGYGLIGYDKIKKEYTSTWIDNFSTSIMNATGSFCNKSNKLTMNTINSCPVSGQTIKGKNITKIIDKNQHIFEMYSLGPDGKEFKTGEITYLRIK